MRTTDNGIQIPDIANPASTDSFASIVGAVIANANASDSMFTTKGILDKIQSDFTQGWWKSTDGFTIAWGYPTGVAVVTAGVPVTGHIDFPTSFPHVCLKVIGSDAGGAGMSFGFYNITNSGCTWCTAEGLGQAGKWYAPSYIAFGW
ncbi:MAG TPA: hypothetical protein VIM42_10120 [Clostridium sp.]